MSKANNLNETSESRRTDIMSERPENVVCEFCFGTGTRLESDEGGIKVAVLCDCRRSNSGVRPLEAARIPPRFRECSFHNYYPMYYSQYFAHSFSCRLRRLFRAARPGRLSG